MLDDSARVCRGRLSGANPTDTEGFCAEAEARSRQLHGVRMTRPSGRSAKRSRSRGLLEAKADADRFVAKSIGLSGRVALETPMRKLASIRDA